MKRKMIALCGATRSLPWAYHLDLFESDCGRRGGAEAQMEVADWEQGDTGQSSND